MAAAAKAKKKTSIGRRIAIMVSLVVVATVFCISGLLASYQAIDGARSKRQSVEAIAFVYASAVADHVASRDSFQILSVLRSVDRVPGVISASVIDSQGNNLGTLGQKAMLESDVAGSDPSFFEMMSTGAVPVSVNIIKNGQVQGTLILVTDISDLRTRFLKTMGFVIVASLMAAFLGVMLSVPLQRRITRPILRLSDTMTAIKDSRDYKSTIPEAGDAETSVMVESFNNLMSDIRFRDASLSKLAYYDPMTGLPNRSNFSKELEERLAKVQGGADSLAVSLLNVDAFHAFNDAFGHSIGDAILMNVAAIISAEAGASAFVARVGGDEFAIILGDNGTGQQAESMLARIHAAFFQPIKFLGVEIHLTMSSGTTLLPRDTSNAGDALRFVDLATNAAKKIGPGRSIFFSKDMDDSVRRETELSQNLRVAIQKSELQTFLQPQLHLATGKVTGFEALLRWKHSTQGYISPAIFIPLAERSGSIAALGSWVLDDSCRIAKSWGKGHMESRSIAVNVSPAQLLQADFIKSVCDILDRFELPPRALCLELTESVFIGRSLSSVRAILDELHLLGVSLALDDFGTGFSSLSYLSQLPFDKLKIDRSFVTAAYNSPRRTEILRSIITMAHSLGMVVVAEGAEDEQEIEMLRKLGADMVQGFGVARPAPEQDALARANQIEAVGSYHMPPNKLAG